MDGTVTTIRQLCETAQRELRNLKLTLISNEVYDGAVRFVGQDHVVIDDRIFPFTAIAYLQVD